MKDIYFEKLIAGFKELKNVEALVLGGSRSTGVYDEKSDYDLYVYVKEMPSLTERKQILNDTCSYIELANKFWEEEDDCTLLNGIDIDIIYRNINDVDKMLYETVFNCRAEIGYTTCFWFNVLKSKVLYEKDNCYTLLVNKYNVTYPKALQENIIKKNKALLTGFLPSYDKQIKKAYNRGDYNSVTHRVTAYLASYFDIILALNGLLHPGEKRLKEYVIANCKIIPQDFSKNLDNLFQKMFTDNVNDAIATLNYELFKLL